LQIGIAPWIPLCQDRSTSWLTEYYLKRFFLDENNPRATVGLLGVLGREVLANGRWQAMVPWFGLTTRYFRMKYPWGVWETAI
jgi:hypothetical protein